MKKTSFIFILLFLSISSFAQKEISLFCQVWPNGYLYYPKNLEKILPDSIKTAIMINPRNDFNMKNIDDVTLFMGANGWRICSFDNKSNYYILSREITVDEPTWELYIQKLKSIEAKK
jgi:hypothetical protein